MAVDNATVNLYINNEQALTAVNELDKAYNELKKARKAAEKAEDAEKYNELLTQEKTALKELGLARSEARKGILDMQKVMEKLSVANLRQLNQAKRVLTSQMMDLNQGTDEYKTKLEQLKRVEDQIAKARGKNNAEQKGFMASLKGAWSNIMPVAGLAGIFITAGNFVKSLITDVWDLTKTIQGDSKRAAQVFGDELGYVELQASKLSKQMGVTNREFVSMTTGVADLLIPLDFTRTQAAKMAVDVQKLAGALNEWTAGKYGVAEVSDRLTKAMLGETEGLKQLGIGIRLDSEEYKELIKQKERDGAESTAQAQALAILDLLYKKSADAQTAYSSSGNELLRFQNSASRGWREMKESMAEWFATTKAERIEKLARTYQALNEEFNRNEATLDRLLPTYTELSTKTNLNEIEQKKLNNAISEIIAIYPQATGAMDEYGNVTSINTERLIIAREAQRLLRLEMQKSTVNTLIDQVQTQLKDLESAMYKQTRAENSLSDTRRNLGRTTEDAKVADAKRLDLILKTTAATTESQKEIGATITMLRQMGMTAPEIAKLANTTFEWNRVFDITADSVENLENKYSQFIASTTETPVVDQGNKSLIDSKKAEIKEAEKMLETTEEEISAKNQKLVKLNSELKRLQNLGNQSKSESKPQAWSLDGDPEFGAKRAALKKQMVDDEFATEEEYSRKLLALEISTLEEKLTTNILKGDELLKVQTTLYDKQLQQDKQQKAERQKLLDIIDSGKSETERAEIEHRKLLITNGLFNEQQLSDQQAHAARCAELTELQYSALLVLEKQHRTKLKSIYTKALADQATKEAAAIQSDVIRRQAAQSNELIALETVEDKKRWLVERFGYENIESIRTAKDADKALTSEYAKENEKITQQSLEKLLNYYKAMAMTLQAMNPMGAIINKDEIAELNKIIDDLAAKLAQVKGEGKPGGEEKKEKDNKTDILGMTVSDWDKLFANIKTGEVSLENIVAIAEAIGQAFTQVSNLMNAMEQKEFKQYEKSQDNKKKTLEKRLKAGAISQESYNKEVAEIDAETDAKREELERKQAERSKMLAVFQAVVSTAVAVVKALELGPIAGPIMAAVIGALGAVQVATILATPVGFENGGYIDVARAQDGKQFRAKNDPLKRGYIDKPHYLVAENGRELVIPNEGVENQTLRPVLDIVAASIARGDIRSVNFNEALSRNTSGFQNGGYTQPQSSSAHGSTPDALFSSIDPALIAELIAAIKVFNATASDPLEAFVILDGERGFVKKYDRYKRNRDNAYL